MSIDPLDRNYRALLKSLRHKRLLAAFAILAESLTLALWRPLIWFLFFAGLWMFQIPQVFGYVTSVLTTALFAIGLAYWLYQDFSRLRWPSSAAVTRRLERDSGLRNRPLSGMQDTLANPEKPETRSLWDKSKGNLLLTLRGIKIKAPTAFLAARDPYGIRLGVVLFFWLGMVIAGPTWNARIVSGLTPLNLESSKDKTTGITLWITPPEYTRLPQLVLHETALSPLEIPQGSQLKAMVSGGFGKPHIVIDEQSFPMKRAGDNNYILERDIPAGHQISIRQSLFTRAQWPYRLIPDNTPAIVQSKEPAALPDGLLRFSFLLFDDYGVETLTLHMELDSEIVESPPILGTPHSETRSVMSPPNEEFSITPVYDLTSHLWAGLPVKFRFEAKDHLGQSSQTPEISLTLPERIFVHPVAQNLAEQRRKLIWEPESDYIAIARALEYIMIRPDLYHHDPVVFLAIRSAASRLIHSDVSKETALSVIALLWDTALRVEDGNLTLAAQNLRDAQMDLEEALNNPEINEQEISRLMQRLREAMAEYFIELQKEMQRRMADSDTMPLVPPELLSRLVSPEVLSSFLDKMEQQMRDGNRQSAQEMLSQLQRMTDMMNPSMAAPMPPDMQMMAEGINELQQLIERQEALLKQTQEQALQLLENIRQSIDTAPHKTEQEALRHMLGQLMLAAADVLPDIPENLGLAEQEMRGSSEQLEDERPDLSVPHQDDALEYLRQSQQQLANQLMEQMQQMTGMSLSGSGGMRYDPLGRPYGQQNGENGMLGSEIEIPDESERKRALEILQILRQRAGERERPDMELDYYKRLLKQF